jgi:hypothetical protein
VVRIRIYDNKAQISQKMKEIILFTSGDSTNASTWSNVPYLMAKHFELNNIVVNRVDISSNRYVRGIQDINPRIFACS